MKRVLLIAALVLTLAIPAQAQSYEGTVICELWDDTNIWHYNDMIWNGSDWEAPIWYQLYWNGTGLDAPPNEYRIISNFNYTFYFMLDGLSVNATSAICVYGMSWDARDYYIGPTLEELNVTGFATNGAVISFSQHQFHSSYSGLFNISWFTRSGWYKFSHIGYVNNSIGSDMSDLRVFYLDTDSPEIIEETIQTQESSPVQILQPIRDLIRMVLSVFEEFLKKVFK